MPDSKGIVFSAKAALWRLSIIGDGTPERLPFVGEDGVMPIVSSSRPDGSARLAYVRSYADANIWRIDLPSAGSTPSSPPTLAISSTRRDAIAQLSSDGRQVTFTSTRSGDSEIWRSDVSGAGAVQLTSMSTNPGWPRWSPNGDLIAFHTNGVDGNGDIFVVPAQGGKPRNVTAHPSTDTFPYFSHDGKWIYFNSSRTGRSLIWKVPVSGGPAVQVSEGSGMMAIESPNAEYLYYTAGMGPNSRAQLWRMPVGGGAAVKIADGVHATAFDVVDGGIYYLERFGAELRLQYLELASRKVVTIVKNLGNADLGLDASPDGRTILFSRVDTSINDLMLVENFR
jgi:eukaryotic-like serine/threonine-protein kinase